MMSHCQTEPDIVPDMVFTFGAVMNIILQLLANPAVKPQVRSLDYLKVILMTVSKSPSVPSVLQKCC